MTRRVGPSEQGQLQGANASIAGLTGAIGPIFFGLVYSLAIGYRAQFDLLGLPFLVAAVLMLGAVGVAVRVTRLSSTVADRGLPVALPDGSPPPSVISLSESNGPAHPRQLIQNLPRRSQSSA